ASPPPTTKGYVVESVRKTASGLVATGASSANSRSYSPSPQPGPVSGLQAEGAEGIVRLTWLSAPNAVHYVVYRCQCDTAPAILGLNGIVPAVGSTVFGATAATNISDTTWEDT